MATPSVTQWPAISTPLTFSSFHRWFKSFKWHHTDYSTTWRVQYKYLPWWKPMPVTVCNAISQRSVDCQYHQWCIAVFGYPPVRNHFPWSCYNHRRPLTPANMRLRRQSLQHCEEWLVKARSWCISGGIDHCYDWGVQNHWTMRESGSGAVWALNSVLC